MGDNSNWMDSVRFELLSDGYWRIVGNDRSLCLFDQIIMLTLRIHEITVKKGNLVDHLPAW